MCGVWSQDLSSAQVLIELDLELEVDPITRLVVFLVGSPAFRIQSMECYVAISNDYWEYVLPLLP